MAEYQGHRSWNAWNVALWIGNEEHLYRLAVEAIKGAKLQARDPARWSELATRVFVRRCFCLGDRTPDGAVYNRLSIRLALEGLAE